MTAGARRGAAHSAARRHVEVDQIVGACTLSVHVTEDGALRSVLGRLDLTTRRYSFLQLPTHYDDQMTVYDPLTWLAIALGLAEEDGEVAQIRLV